MKKYIYSLFVALVAVAGLVACSDDDKYEWATVSGNQVFFSNELPSTYNLTSSATSFTVPLNRYKTDEAINVDLVFTSPDGADTLFSVPSSVNFAAGQSEADIVINFDPSAFEYNDFRTINLAIGNEDYTTPYGNTSVTLKAGLPLTWSSIGQGTYVDNWYHEYKGSVEIFKCDQNPNRFRIAEPYAGFGGNDFFEKNNEADPYLDLMILQKGQTLGGVTIEHDDLVYFDEYSTGNTMTANGYNTNIVLLHVVNFTAGSDEANWLHSKVVEWQGDGLPAVIQLAPYFYMYGLGGFNNSQNDEVIQIYFPGLEVKDYDVAVEYLGAFVDADGEKTASTNFEVGTDLDEVKYALIEGEDVDAALNGILDGSIETESISQSGTVNIPCPYVGTVTVVAVGYAEGEAQTYDAATFSYKLGGDSSWKVVGSGDFLYTSFFANDDGSPYNDEGLVLSQSIDYESLYKVSHWGYDVDFYFIWDKTTNRLTVPAQYSGYTHSSYGKVYVADLVNYDEETPFKDAPSTYDPETGVFTFNLIYYVSAGYFGYGEETFTVTWGGADAAAAPQKAAFRSNAGFKPAVKAVQTKKAAQKAHRIGRRASQLVIDNQIAE